VLGPPESGGRSLIRAIGMPWTITGGLSGFAWNRRNCAGENHGKKSERLMRAVVHHRSVRM
jgi:hypothetical protein